MKTVSTFDTKFNNLTRKLQWKWNTKLFLHCANTNKI